MKIFKLSLIVLLVFSNVCLFVTNNVQNKAIVELLSVAERQAVRLGSEVKNSLSKYFELASKIDLLSIEDESLTRKYRKLDGDVQFFNDHTDRKLKNLFNVDKNLTKNISNVEEDLSEKYDALTEVDIKLSTSQSLLVSTQTSIVDILTVPDYEYLKSVTVFIKGVSEISDETGSPMSVQTFTGTGIVVDIDEDYTYILSNNHVFNDNDSTVLYVEEEEKEYKIEVIARHPVLDMALGKVKGTIINKRKIRGFAIAKPQDKLFLVGNPVGRKFNYGEGVFAGYDEEFAVIQVPILPGNSGSGVFDQQGKLVGIAFAVMSNYLGCDFTHGIAVDGKDVIEFLKQDVVDFLGKYL